MQQTGQQDDLHDRPVGDLVRQATEQAQTLVRQEVELAKLELSEKARKGGLGAGMFGGAALFALAAFAVLTVAFIAAVELLTPLWLAALIVAAVYGAVAAALALSGRHEVQEAAPAVPEETVETVKEDVAWTKERAQAGRR